jgi:ubiquitin-associated SH3 domain-containing protein
MLSQFIVYACPIGNLAEQLDRYFQVSLETVGANSAHRYMPHCTLTGFFYEVELSVSRYVDALSQSLAIAQPHRPASPITIRTLSFKEDWHGLELDSDWLKALVADFSNRVESLTRPDPIRLKSWLHLSLAYGFEPSHASQLKALAIDSVDLDADVAWELRLYQRFSQETGDRPSRFEPTEEYGGDRWRCHYRWTL